MRAPAYTFVIARRASRAVAIQPFDRLMAPSAVEGLDCFVAALLAMTGEKSTVMGWRTLQSACEQAAYGKIVPEKVRFPEG